MISVGCWCMLRYDVRPPKPGFARQMFNHQKTIILCILCILDDMLLRNETISYTLILLSSDNPECCALELVNCFNCPSCTTQAPQGIQISQPPLPSTHYFCPLFHHFQVGYR